MYGRVNSNAVKANETLTQLLLRPKEERDLVWYHQVGEQVERLCPSGDRAYGQGVMQQLAKTLHFSATRLLQARQFARTYRRAEVREMDKPTRTGYVLRWAHVIPLMANEDSDERAKLQEECVEGEWSSRELWRRVKETRAPKSQGGRKFQKPADGETALRQLIEESRDWIARYNEIWFPDGESAMQLPKTKTRKLTAQASEAAEVLEALADEADRLLKEGKQES